MFVWATLIPLVVGLILGLRGLLAAGHLIQGMLVQARVSDPLNISVAVAALTVVAVLATVRPAKRMTQLDPVLALKTD